MVATLITLVMTVLLSGCAFNVGRVNASLVCDRTVHPEHLREMEHAKCSKQLPIQISFKF